MAESEPPIDAGARGRAGRRGFLRKGLSTVGAAAGLVGLGALGQEVVKAEARKAGRKPPPMPVLTPDGCLLHMTPPDEAAPKAPPSDALVREGIPGREWAMVIDLSRCEGCRSCTIRCGARHHVPAPREWIKVYPMQDAPSTAPYWMPKPCFHCDNPPCTKVCPVGATFKRKDGIVLVDNERCIGCRFCMAACPYSARFFNWGRPSEPSEATSRPYSPETGFPRRVGTVEKCDFCPDMLAQGKLPCCVAQCARGVFWFGDQNEDAVTNGQGETRRLSSLLKDNAGYRFLEDLGTEPRVYYLPPKQRLYPAPGEAKPGTGEGK
jgi:molybdopterin-containing oxidoreductase family iron-sulfur binding subunit